MRRHGFTIIELLLLLTVFAFLAAASVRAYFLQPEVTLENAATLLAHDLRAAQNRSAYLGVPCRFAFFEDGDGYEVTDENGEVVRNPRTQNAFERRYSYDGVFDGVYIESVDAGGDRALVYDARGEPIGRLTVELAFGPDRRLVWVEPRSGRVVIEGSTSHWVDPGY